VAQVQLQTADVVDTGYTSFVNFRRTPTGPQKCNETQDFLGASGVDWCIKSIGGALFREYANTITLEDQTTDIALTATYRRSGYNSQLRAMIPLGFNDRDKIVRGVLLDHDTSSQDPPCVVHLRIGNSFSLVDVNDTEDVCAPMWHVLPDKPLSCPDSASLTALAAKHQRPDRGTTWPCYEQGRFLWFELTIQNADGTPAIGGDTCLQRVDFDAMAMRKPNP
jgi:hypothetical protein